MSVEHEVQRSRDGGARGPRFSGFAPARRQLKGFVGLQPGFPDGMPSFRQNVTHIQTLECILGFVALCNVAIPQIKRKHLTATIEMLF